jgi:hypothetical protein
MGHRRKRTEYNLSFLDPELSNPDNGDALQVRIRSLSIDRFLHLVDLVNEDASNTAASRELVEVVAEHLVSWNLEDEAGTPVAITPDGIASEDRALLTQIVIGWLRAMTAVPAPLEPGSNGTGTLEGASLPMEVSSAPLPN